MEIGSGLLFNQMSFFDNDNFWNQPNKYNNDQIHAKGSLIVKNVIIGSDHKKIVNASF